MSAVHKLRLPSPCRLPRSLRPQPNPHASSNPPATLRIGLWTLVARQGNHCLAHAGGLSHNSCLRNLRGISAHAVHADSRQRSSVSPSPTIASRRGLAHWPGHISRPRRNPNPAQPADASPPARGTDFGRDSSCRSYVERVVASESGPADGAESLKALAIVVRTFALHQAHGHADYDLCDSTHCQILHWGGKPDSSEKPSPQKSGPAKSGPTFLSQPFAESAGSRAAATPPRSPLPAKRSGSTDSARKPGSIRTAAGAPHRQRKSGPRPQLEAARWPTSPCRGSSRASTPIAQPTARASGPPRYLSPI